MPTYYLVTQSEDSMRTEVGLFTDETLAQRLAGYLAWGQVIPIVLDAYAPALAAGQFPYVVILHDDGTLEHCFPTDPPDLGDVETEHQRWTEAWTTFIPFARGHRIDRPSGFWDHPETGGYTYIWATSPEDALRSAQARQQVLTNS